MRVVLDTNIWISGILKPSSNAGKVIAAWKHAQLSIITSAEILDELKRVLHYPKIRKLIRWDEKKINLFVNSIEFLSEFIALDDEISVTVPRDKDDDHILNALITSSADFLITCDKDLLDLRDNHSIITLDEFCQLVF